MNPAFRAFAAELIDYAGLFPPARLAMEPAAVQYARHRTEDEAWMLARFICPVARLDELMEHESALPRPLRLSVILAGGETVEAARTAARADLEALHRLRTERAANARVEAIEHRLPDELFERGADSGSVARYARALVPAIEAPAGQDLQVFFEIRRGPRWREDVEATARAIATLDEGRGRPTVELEADENPRPRFGFKLRCGGVTADAFPSIDEVAAALDLCRKAGVPMKATAGLHHPLPRQDADAGARMHGFFNVFGAGILAHVHALDEGEVAEILSETEASAFRFDDAGLAWRERSVTPAEIRSARADAMTSFGSCSFEEPVEDLAALGLLR